MKKIISILTVITAVICFMSAFAIVSYSFADTTVLSDGDSCSFDDSDTIPRVSSYGVRITVEGACDAKDLFIAKGKYNSYNEIKRNGYIVRVTASKLSGKESYTYTVSQSGMHTVLIRYSDGRWYIFHEELVVEEPEIAVDGLRITVKNIKDVKVIRTAYGEYYTSGNTKRADRSRSYSGKVDIKGREEYTLQYREEGRVTVAVEYNNGYVRVFHCDIIKKRPVVEQSGNTVTFSDLEGLVLIRYALGEYTSSSEIKKAADSKVIKPNAVSDGKITVNLAYGEYTFCVQYNDESHNYYVISIEEARGRFSKHYEYINNDGEAVDTLPYWLYTPVDASEDMPLIVVLHSAHAKINNDLDPQENLDNMVQGDFDDIPKYIYNGDLGDIPAYIVMPQTTASSRGWSKRGKEIVGLVEYCKRNFNIDSTRVSLIGYSIGATGAIELASSYPDVFSRVISVAGGLDGVTNNTRPYLPAGMRLSLSDSLYPDLRVLKTGSSVSYEKETMKYLFAEQESRYRVVTEEEIYQANVFLKERTESVASSLSGSVSVWCIVGDKDTEVAPYVSEELCRITDNAKCDVLNGYGHAAVMKYCREIRNEIIDYLTADE